MSTLVLAVLLAASASDQPGAGGAQATPRVEGKWLIQYAEEGGRRNNAWEQRQATIRGNTLSFEQDGREQTIQLTFGPNQTLRATAGRGQGGDGQGAGQSFGTLTGTHSGVFIAAQEFLCISLNKTTGRGTEGTQGQASADKGQGDSSGAFILILRRQR
jgi:hypothetical protein